MPNLRTPLTLLGAALLVGGLSGCGKYDRDAPVASSSDSDTAAIEKAIRADEQKWNDEFQAKPRSLDALTAHYSDQAYFVAPGVKPTSGIVDIRKAYAEGLKDPKFDISFTVDKVGVAKSGDIAWSQGHFKQQWTDSMSKKVATGTGTFLTIYAKQKDGSWKAVQDFSALDPPEASSVM